MRLRSAVIILLLAFLQPATVIGEEIEFDDKPILEGLKEM